MHTVKGLVVLMLPVSVCMYTHATTVHRNLQLCHHYKMQIKPIIWFNLR